MDSPPPGRAGTPRDCSGAGRPPAIRFHLPCCSSGRLAQLSHAPRSFRSDEARSGVLLPGSLIPDAQKRPQPPAATYAEPARFPPPKGTECLESPSRQHPNPYTSTTCESHTLRRRNRLPRNPFPVCLPSPVPKPMVFVPVDPFLRGMPVTPGIGRSRSESPHRSSRFCPETTGEIPVRHRGRISPISVESQARPRRLRWRFALWPAALPCGKCGLDGTNCGLSHLPKSASYTATAV
jgi:hypothetical protein